MRRIFFLRGLNTYGDEYQRLGLLRFGLISKHLARDLKTKGWELIPVLDIGAGTLTRQIERAYEFLNQCPEWIQSTEKVDLFGHSIGGLMARALVHRPEIGNKVRSVITVGTPHHGAHFAELAMNLMESRPLLYKMGALFRYDTQKRISSFEEITPTAIEKFNRQYPNLPEIRYASLIGNISVGWRSFPYKILHFQFREFLGNLESDGMIPVHSQMWGDVIGTYRLDHIMQVGYCLDLSPRIKRNFQAEYFKMIRDLSLYLETLGS